MIMGFENVGDDCRDGSMFRDGPKIKEEQGEKSTKSRDRDLKVRAKTKELEIGRHEREK